MTQNRALMALAILAVVSACNDANAPTSTLRPYNLGGSRLIDDAAHGGDNPFIFFLPPMVSKPSISATFHAGLRPRVEICALDNGSCTPFKSFSPSDVRMSLTDKHYQVNWDTKAPALDPAKTYRIEVLLGDTRIGYADVDAVSNGSQLKSVDTERFIALVDGRTLPIKFFLGQGVTCPENSNGCAEYTVKAAEGGSFQSLDKRSATVIPAGASPVEEFTLTIEKVSVEASASCHGAPRAAGVTLLKEFNDCYHYKTEPDIFGAGGFRDPTPGDEQFTRSDRVVVAMCVDEAAAGPFRPFLQIFKSDPPPRPLYALDDAEEGVDFPVGLLNCEATVGALPPAPGSGLLAHLGYGARRLAASLVGFVTPRPAYAIDLGEGGFLGIGDGYSDFRWGVAGHLHAGSPLTRSVTAGSPADFSVALEAHSHHGGESQASLGISGESIQFTIINPAGTPSAGPVAPTNADGLATAQITFGTVGDYRVTARHPKGGDVVTFNVTVTSASVPVTLTFADPATLSTICDGPSGCGEGFVQNGYIVQSFWYDPPQAPTTHWFSAHLHTASLGGNWYEEHHFQGDLARQGVRIRREDGKAFALQSIDYRNATTPFEIGTSAITAITSPPSAVVGYTQFPVTTSATFQTRSISGFAGVNEVWITMHGGAGWDNIVVSGPPSAIVVSNLQRLQATLSVSKEQATSSYRAIGGIDVVNP